MARRNAEVLELAVLGLLHETPMHGYELRKRFALTLGSFRALSYGSLYPALRSLVAQGLITGTEEPRDPGRSAARTPATGARRAEAGAASPRAAGVGRRARIVYELTQAGVDRFADLLAQSGPAAWEDGDFELRFAFFSHVDRATRLRVLEGRRTRLRERLELVRSGLARTRDRFDAYGLELRRHGVESVEREVRWLDDLIDAERRGVPPGSPPDPAPATPAP